MGNIGIDVSDDEADRAADEPHLGDVAVRRRAGRRRSRASSACRPVTARLLCIRGLGDPDEARRFLSPRLDDLHDPFRSRTWRPRSIAFSARSRASERIAIHGDYDVDGVTSTVILRRALELLGADVVHFIPERLRDGYGLQPATIDRLHADGVRAGHLRRLRHPRATKPRSAHASWASI